jgi:hypothetical protein
MVLSNKYKKLFRFQVLPRQQLQVHHPGSQVLGQAGLLRRVQVIILVMPELNH